MNRECGLVLQVNISNGGVPKRPVSGAFAGPLGLHGDAVAHPAIHGGPRQALLLIAAEAVDEVAAEGFPIFYGALGENLTTRGLDPRSLRAGQRYRAGEALLELTKPRTPCRTLDVYGQGIQSALWEKTIKTGNTESPLWGRSGFYAAVLEPGIIRPEDIIRLVD
ncbi:MAG: MOSC domain-containing protein [Bryobacteraceae bacterium]|nr:MOSC domain-containing protein [Bryobacteraceae bacterium]